MHKLMFKNYRYFFGISLLLGLALNLGTPLCAQISYFNIIHPLGDNNADIIETDSSYVIMQQGIRPLKLCTYITLTKLWHIQGLTLLTWEPFTKVHLMVFATLRMGT
jgi:hypothetical protein